MKAWSALVASLREEYQTRHDAVLKPIADAIQADLSKLLRPEPRIDRVTTRAKAIESFLAKAAKTKADGTPKYADPIAEIQDQVGAMVVTFYLSDVERVADVVRAYFSEIEEQAIAPESTSAFDYEGRHLILHIPKEVLHTITTLEERPKFFELQIKTLFQHAWAQANHDLGYKSDRHLSDHERRQIAFTAAQAWGADWIFNDLLEKQIAAGRKPEGAG
jgi:ppGpp synthetase/RelA/SpoT-type nucleotidyltranferase